MPDNHDLSIDQLRDIVQDAHLNFLIGAGASSEFFGVLGDIENILTGIEASDASIDAKKRARVRVRGIL